MRLIHTYRTVLMSRTQPTAWDRSATVPPTWSGCPSYARYGGVRVAVSGHRTLDTTRGLFGECGHTAPLVVPVVLSMLKCGAQLRILNT